MSNEKLEVLDGDGHGDSEDIGPESQEELEAVHKKLSELARKDGQVITMAKQQLTLLKHLITPPESEKHKDLFYALMICDFLDDEEADNELAGFFEAERLGMDRDWNLAHMLSRVSINRKGPKTNRPNSIIEMFMHQKLTTNYAGNRNDYRRKYQISNDF